MTVDQRRRIENAINAALTHEDTEIFVSLSREDWEVLVEVLKSAPIKKGAGRPTKSIRDQVAEKETEIVVRVLQMQRDFPKMELKELMTKLGLLRNKSKASIQQQINTFEKTIRARELAAVALMLGRREPAGKK